MAVSVPRVIVVEDDPGMRQAMIRILGLGGFEPVAFASAEDMLAADNSTPALCMIIDVQLPGISGFALHERLASLGRASPSIFISAFEETEARAHATRAGAPFLPKPFSGHSLLDMVRRFVDAPAP